MSSPKPKSKSKMIVRNLKHADIARVRSLVERVYPDEDTYTISMLVGQLNRFPDGQFVVLIDEDIVGYAATFRISEAEAFKPHDWIGITGNGHLSRHDENGDWLYGMEVCVDPNRRRLKIGNRLYNARMQLCQELQLKGILFGGRMPGFDRKRRLFPTPSAYLQAVIDNKIKDSVISFHRRMGFEPTGVLANYSPADTPSGGHATLMVWRNHDYTEPETSGVIGRVNRDLVRIVSVQKQARTISHVDEFFSAIDYFVEVASDYKGDFVLFPELFTLELLSCEAEVSPDIAIQRMTEYTERFVQHMSQLAVRTNINIIGGSHPTKTDDGELQNVGYVFLRDGSIHMQEKLHPTPDEKYWWSIQGGDEINVIQTDCGPIGVMICYDSEFPEIGRRLADQGAQILFVPYCTDTRQGHLRVKYCCQARAIENQLFVATSGMVGNLKNVANIDINYAQSAIYTPSDFAFARDGIAAEATENAEMVVVADVDLSNLRHARAQGEVRNLKDRRLDLYTVKWKEPRR